MLDILVSEILKGAVSIAKDILGKRVIETNEVLLFKKKDKEKNKKSGNILSPEVIAKLALSSSERVSAKCDIEQNETLTNLNSHIKHVRKWCKGISFKDSIGVKNISGIYIELETYLMPLRTHLSISEKNSKIPLKKAIFNHDNHCLVLGQPGAGKTTSIKKVCFDFFDDSDGFKYNLPILIRFRDLKLDQNDDVNLINEISSLFSFKLHISNSNEKSDYTLWRQDITLALLEEFHLIILLDGFDELPTSIAKKSVLRDVRILTDNLRNSKILITCRTGEFDYHLNNTNTFEISSLSIKQIYLLASKWLGNNEKARKFLQDVENSPFSDTAIKPLILAHLCAIYERIGSIPDKPKTVYRKVVGLLLDEWDAQRSINRESNYSKFEVDRKFEFLSNLAFNLTVHYHSTVFSSENLEKTYKQIYRNFGLPENQAHRTINELESHTGLFLQTGYQKYEFVHKSIQEYLAAEYLVRLPSLKPIMEQVKYLGSELAIATSISSNPSLYFSEIVLGMFSLRKLDKSFYSSFVSRLIQEAPDFYPEVDVIIAALTILNERPSDRMFVELMKDIIKGDDICLAFKYYKMHKTKGGFITLLNENPHPYYKLKTFLHLLVNEFTVELLSPLLKKSEKNRKYSDLE